MKASIRFLVSVKFKTSSSKDKRKTREETPSDPLLKTLKREIKLSTDCPIAAEPSNSERLQPISDVPRVPINNDWLALHKVA